MGAHQVASGATGGKSHTVRRYVRDVLADTFAGSGQHATGQMAAAIAYYSALTLAPTILLALMVAGLFFDEAMVAESMTSALAPVIGLESVELISDAVLSLFDLKSSGPLAVVGLLTLVFGATGLLLQVRLALRRIWGSNPTGGVVRVVLKERAAALLALGVLVAAFVLLLGAWWAVSLLAPEQGSGVLQNVATWAITFGLALGAYRFLPSASVSWRASLVGAAVATLGWLIASEGIGIYFSVVPTATLYGAASSLLVILVWVYVAATVLLFGGELARAVDRASA